MNEHAQALGRLAKGKPKRYSDQERARRRERIVAAGIKYRASKAESAKPPTGEAQ